MVGHSCEPPNSTSASVPLRRWWPCEGEAMTDETERLLSEILQYVRATAVSSVRPQAGSVIDSGRKANVYAAMTGDKSQPEIASRTDVQEPTISRNQSSYFAAGIPTTHATALL